MDKLILSASAATLLLASTGAQASGWTWLAGAEEGYKAEPTVSLMLGQMEPDDGDGDSISGIELSLNCPLVQPPSNRIRQQFSITSFDDDVTEITSIELNPHYVVEVSPGLEVGGGPGLGYVMVETPGADEAVFGLQLGVSAHYHGSGPLFVGAEARYQFTTEADFGAGDADVNNTRVAVKLGYSF